MISDFPSVQIACHSEQSEEFTSVFAAARHAGFLASLKMTRNGAHPSVSAPSVIKT
jgi:hypothetical protein